MHCAKTTPLRSWLRLGLRRTLPYGRGSDWGLGIYEDAIVADGDVDRRQLLPLRQTSQNLTRNLGQQRVGQNVVYVARAALDLGTPLRHLIDERFVVGQRDAVVLLNAALT